MAFQHGKSTGVLCNEFNLSSHLNSLEWERTCDELDVTTFGSDWRKYIAGLFDGSMSAEGFFDSTASTGLNTVLAAIMGASGTELTFALQGVTQDLGRVKIASVIETTKDTDSPVDGAVSLAAEFTPNGGVWGGVMLSPLSAKTATGSGSEQDDTFTSTTDGWVANLHVTAVSGTSPSATVKIQDSADGSTYADLSGAAFTAVTAVGSQQISGTGEVRRYLQAVWTITGTTPSLTFAVAFARK